MAEYKRVQGKSYMIYRAEEKVFGYELKMVEQNKVEGFVPLELEWQEDGIEFWYDISGKQDLESYQKFQKMDSNFLKKMLTSLQQAVLNLGEYLLSEEGISLEPTRIFVDTVKNTICFCYTPFEKSDFTESLKTFMEYFLQHMEHGDKEDIQICYEVYEYVQKEHLYLEDILQTFWQQANSSDTVQEELQELSDFEEEEKELQKSLKKKYVLPMPKFYKTHFFDKQKQEEEAFVFEPVEEEQKESSAATVFLGSEVEEILGELRYEGTGAQKNIKISKAEFLIGKEKGEADGEICAPSVSRMHAKISKDGENYYIEDLNSRNGTYTNDRLLNYKEKVLLKKNDSIRFAEETYRFV